MSESQKRGLSSSTPSFTEFNPDYIPYQRKVIRLIKKEFDFNLGTLEILLSGSVGSAKSILAAHLGIFHCMAFPGARLLLARRSMPDLKDTIFQKVLEHLEGCLVDGKDYWINLTRASIKFRNGSEVISRSWADKKYKKFRSLELSMAIFEELTENNTEDKQAYDETKMRLGRLPHIKENLIISCTNPDSPSHWAYDYFITANVATRFVFYSVTTDNPFLPESYVRQLKEEMDPRLARRMIYGEWIEIAKEVVYYNYDREVNFKNESYKVDKNLPITISWDFNIGISKPLSAVLYQEKKGVIHIFQEVVVEGMRTAESCDELAHRKLLGLSSKYFIAGDASGRARDTRSNKSDWDIIKKFFSNYKDINFEMRVPRANPPVRDRHNAVNGLCKNALGQVKLIVYKDAPTVDKGLRLTQLKKGGSYIEDDSKPYQHITTALGYGIMAQKRRERIKPQATIRL